MTETLSGDQARDIAKEWLECEPDLKNREEIEALLAGPESELIQRFTGHLEFGTAGLRGPLGAGPQRMNRPLVQMTAAAIAQRLLEDDQKESPLVVVGFDARKQSDVFASDTARVLANQNIRCVLLPKALPTPVLAFSVLQINASAGIMVTASHNPRQDNGYKVYWKDGAQINTPLDKEISTYLDGIKPNEVELAPLDSPLITFDEGNLLEQYLDMAASCVSKVPDSELK
ncbi:MAG: phospho-sugar mutase, partial [Actinomycetota bacterium]|nr:phospho-sugar mutase [Actinomycetota bacterium]